MKNKLDDIIDDLLVKQLLGEASIDEIGKVDKWLNESAANRKYYEDFRMIWEQSKQLASKNEVDEQAAWSKLQQRINSDDSHVSGSGSFEYNAPVKSIPLYRNTWMRVAAALLVLLGSAWMYFNFSWQVTRQANEVAITETLPDGSVVVLNRNASISYPSRFLGKSRNVSLTGEAFFTVTPNKDKPFIIAANEAAVKVVGTSFNVKTTENKTEVIVETGIVEVSKVNKGITLKPHQKATVTKEKAVPELEQNTDELYTYYRTKEFVCNATPLYRLTDVLSEAYDVKISITDERIRTMPITTVFHNEPIDAIIDVVCATLNLRSAKEGNEIKLYSK